MQDITLADLFNRVGSCLLKLSQDPKHSKISTEHALPLCINYTSEGKSLWKLMFSAGTIEYINKEIEDRDGYCYTFNDTLEYSETGGSVPTDVETAFHDSRVTLNTEEESAINDLENRISKLFYGESSKSIEDFEECEDESSVLSTIESVEAWKNGTLSTYECNN